MKLKSRLIACLMAIGMVSGCNQAMRTANVGDVSKPETITLAKLSSQGNIHSIAIVGKGHLDGTAEIVLILNGRPYKTEKLSGDVDFKWGGDWYADTSKISYKPISVTNGILNLKYAFYD